jgi:hypothetical protein
MLGRRQARNYKMADIYWESKFIFAETSTTFVPSFMVNSLVTLPIFSRIFGLYFDAAYDIFLDFAVGFCFL